MQIHRLYEQGKKYTVEKLPNGAADKPRFLSRNALSYAEKS